MEELRCIGCGSILQSENDKLPGFVPKQKLTSEDENIVCKRCFRLSHYNEVIPTILKEEDFFLMLSNIPKEGALIVHIIDMMDIEGTLIPQIKRLTNNNDLILIGNKTDLLPKAVRANKLIHNLKEIASSNDLKTDNVLVMSALKNHGLDDAIKDILVKAGQKDIYIVGMTNVGKSTFINHVLRSVEIVDTDLITVSHHPGTTLDFIKIPIGDNYLVDTPGIMNKKSVRSRLSDQSNKMITPTKEIKPKTYQLDIGQTLFLGGVARLDFKNRSKVGVTVYIANQCKVHRTKTLKADALMTEQIGSLLTPPFDSSEIDGFKKVTLNLPFGTNDIVIPGLGFVTMRASFKVDVYTDKHVMPYVRRALI